MNLFGIALLAGAGFALVMYLRGRSRDKADAGPSRAAGSLPGGAKGALPSAERTVLTLRLNDIVSHLDQDYMIEGKLTYREAGDAWWEYMLVDGDDVVWLSVEDDDRLEVQLWTEIAHRPAGDDPGEHIEWEGVTYRCKEKGKATVSRDGKTGRKEGLECLYWDYEGPNKELLAVEKWGSSWEAYVGKALIEGSYDILPGDLVD